MGAINQDVHELAPFCGTWYARASRYVLHRLDGMPIVIRATSGWDQGDPLAPAGYSIGSLRALRSAKLRIRRLVAAAAGEAVAAVVLLFAYLDDVLVLFFAVLLLLLDFVVEAAAAAALGGGLFAFAWFALKSRKTLNAQAVTNGFRWNSWLPEASWGLPGHGSGAPWRSLSAPWRSPSAPGRFWYWRSINGC